MSSQDFPGDCVGPDYQLPPFVVPADVAPGLSLAVGIGAIYNPWRFFVLINREGFLKELNRIMKKMDAFYKPQEDKYRMPVEAISPGVYCLYNFHMEYSRCRVDSVLEDGTVEVIYVDFGGSGVVPNDKLLFLHKDFSNLPPQAITCRCANIIPPNYHRRFSQKAGKRLLELVQNKSLFAVIAQFDRRRLMMTVSLVDTNGAEDVHFSGKLIEEGLAAPQLELPLWLIAEENSGSETESSSADSERVVDDPAAELWVTSDEQEDWNDEEQGNLIEERQEPAVQQEDAAAGQ